MATDKEHLRRVISTADSQVERLGDINASLFQALTQLLAGAPLQEGRLFDVAWALGIRADLERIVREEFLGPIDLMIREYGPIAEELRDMLAEYAPFARLDAAVVGQLQTMAYQGFESLGQEFVETVARQVYENSLTTATFSEGVAAIQSSVDVSLGRVAKTALHDSLMQFDAVLNTQMSLDAGAEKFLYYGPDDEVTRDHCDKHVGKVMTLEEIEEAWSGDWAGKIDGNPLNVRGGYNCRHHFRGYWE